MKEHYSNIIAIELNLSKFQVQNTIRLLDEGATIPFIARYRKEMTGSLTEIDIIKIRDRVKKLVEIDNRRETILSTIKEQGNLTPALEKKIQHANTLTELEDIYLPFKPKRKTLGSIAKEKGLEPLARLIMAQKSDDIYEKATQFVNKEKGINNEEEALKGARDIAAEWMNEHGKAREILRNLFFREAILKSKVKKAKEEDGIKYKAYFDHSELLNKAPSHRILAIFRGEKENFLKVTVFPPEEEAYSRLERVFVKGSATCSEQVMLALKDSYKRLLRPSLETEIRSWAKSKADEAAIVVFADNLRQLLLASPLGQKNVLAIDPGFKSGCKIVCLDKQGNLMHNETIYPHPPQNETRLAMHKITSLVDAYKIEAIAIGNGTAGRETEYFIRRIRFGKDVIAIMVNESGASVYSASAIAREEFPEYDITVRGAVSIGRRLMDPLAELVKIDPKSIGVGQYQHDVNQSALQESLKDVVISCVNAIGVEVNTASKQVLTYVSGVGPVLAQNIIDYRTQHEIFTSREELKNVDRFGEKAFEQAAGFLRISNAENLLDSSAVHPESYDIVNRMAERVGASISELIANEKLREKINLGEFVTEFVGLPTLNDIMQELAKPGRDLRKRFELFEFDKEVRSIKDLKVGIILPGIVTNITAFGAFIDIGVHQDGLVHISKISNKFIRDPGEVLRLNQKVKVKVMDVDMERKRIGLSMKDVEG